MDCGVDNKCLCLWDTLRADVTTLELLKTNCCGTRDVIARQLGRCNRAAAGVSFATLQVASVTVGRKVNISNPQNTAVLKMFFSIKEGAK